MRLLITLAGAAMTVGFAVPALADTPPPSVPDNPAADAAFLSSLDKAGMHYSDAPSAIAAGKFACDLMNAHASEKDVIDNLSMHNPGLNTGGAMKFAAYASQAYCPEYLTQSSAPSKGSSPFGGFGGH